MCGGGGSSNSGSRSGKDNKSKFQGPKAVDMNQSKFQGPTTSGGRNAIQNTRDFQNRPTNTGSKAGNGGRDSNSKFQGPTTSGGRNAISKTADYHANVGKPHGPRENKGNGGSMSLGDALLEGQKNRLNPPTGTDPGWMRNIPVVGTVAGLVTDLEKAGIISFGGERNRLAKAQQERVNDPNANNGQEVKTVKTTPTPVTQTPTDPEDDGDELPETPTETKKPLKYRLGTPGRLGVLNNRLF